MTILVQSFLNSGTKLATTATTATTVMQLKSLINSAEGVSTTTMQFYIIHDSTTSTALTNNASTLGSYGITTSTVIYSSNTISTVTNKVDRQVAKLELAQLRRKAAGNTSATYYRSFNTYDIDLLADKYTSNTTTIRTTATLAVHRPWVNAPTLFTSNLVLNLDPESSSSYPGSGTTWFDIAGTAQNLALVGSPTFTNTTPKYFTFNGTTQRATGSDTGVIASTAYTKSAWFYLNGYQDNNIFSGDGHFIYMGPQANIDRKIYCGHSNWGSFTAFPSVSTINLNTWYNVTLTFSTTNGMALYINGVLDATYTAQKTAHPGTGSVSVGAYVAGNLLNGRVGKVLAYNTELTAAQVLQNFNATKAIYGV